MSEFDDLKNFLSNTGVDVNNLRTENSRRAITPLKLGFNKGDIVTVKVKEGEVCPGYGYKFRGYYDTEVAFVEIMDGLDQGVSISNLIDF